MKANTVSIELATTAMCVWETLNIPNHTDGPYGAYLEAALADQGVAEMRERAANLAVDINWLYDRVGEFYDLPFDMEFVPGIIQSLFTLAGHFGVASWDRTLTHEDLMAAWTHYSSADLDLQQLLDPGTQMKLSTGALGIHLVAKPADAEPFTFGDFRSVEDARAARRAFERLQGNRADQAA